jgi:hypothetical protein
VITPYITDIACVRKMAEDDPTLLPIIADYEATPERLGHKPWVWVESHQFVIAPRMADRRP